MAGNGIIRQHAEIAVEIPAPRPPAPLLRPAGARLPPAEEVEYSDSDGSFLLQNLKHSAQLLYASQAIEQHFRDARAPRWRSTRRCTGSRATTGPCWPRT